MFVNGQKVACCIFLDLSSDLAALELGQVVKATITEVTDQGALCELESGVKGIAMEKHLIGELYG